MKKTIITFVVCILTFTACVENERDLFDSKASVYFQVSEEFGRTDVDSLVYSFAVTTKNTDVVEMNVKLLGETVDYDRYFKVEVVEELTTAQEGINFAPLDEQYVFPANEITASIPVVLYNTDELRNSTFKIRLRLLESSDFEIGVVDKLEASLLFTDRLVEPDYWSQILYLFFGPYNRTKHKTFIELYGIDFPDDILAVYMQYGMWAVYGNELNQYFIDNYPVYDDEGEIIEPWEAWE